jgi:hypothetical protein
MRPPKVAWALLPLLLAGCPKQQPPRPRELKVFSLQLRDVTPEGLRVPALDRADLQARAEALLGGARVFKRVAAAEPGAYRVQVELGVAPDVDDLTAGDLVLTARARASVPDSLDAVVLQTSGLAPLASGADAETLRASARRVLKILLQDLAYQAGLVLAPEPELTRALGIGSDPQRLLMAIEIAAARRSRAAVPALIKLLKHRREEVADRAIGALAAIGDRRAVYHLTRLVELRDTRKLAKVIDAIGSLGGKEARQFLELLASGHSDEDIKSMAQEALDRMKRSGK